ncbi:hypothetical protein HC891_00180 [Candidatus Gracilibacteria bacterium]|nr:hypothetical protein [Candidatus Gracilibacteria bacterium]
MRGTIVCLFTALVFLANFSATLVASPARASDAFINPELLGMVVRDPWYDFGTNPAFPNQPNYAAQERMGQVLEQAGVRWVRLEFFVDGQLPEASDMISLTHISRYDYFINEVAPRHNLKVLALLGFGVVRGEGPLDKEKGLLAPTTVDPIYGGGVNPYLRTWLDRARFIAARYQGKIAAYEVLNEHNRLPAPYPGEQVPPEIAARLHTKFYRFFKFEDREVPPPLPSWRDTVAIVVGGLHPAGTGPDPSAPTMTDREYLKKIYTSSAFREYFNNPQYGNKQRYPLDGLGFHPYPEEIRASLQSSLDLIAGRLDEVRELLTELGAKELPLWITEIGYNAGYARQNAYGQAVFMRSVFQLLAQRGDVAHIFWFKYEDFPPAEGSNAQRWGIVRIPFTSDSRCPGGACYALNGDPAYYRLSYHVYRELAGLPVYQQHLPVLQR